MRMKLLLENFKRFSTLTEDQLIIEGRIDDARKKLIKTEKLKAASQKILDTFIQRVEETEKELDKKLADGKITLAQYGQTYFDTFFKPAEGLYFVYIKAQLELATKGNLNAFELLLKAPKDEE